MYTGTDRLTRTKMGRQMDRKMQVRVRTHTHHHHHHHHHTHNRTHYTHTHTHTVAHIIEFVVFDLTPTVLLTLYLR